MQASSGFSMSGSQIDLFEAGREERYPRALEGRRIEQNGNNFLIFGQRVVSSVHKLATIIFPSYARVFCAMLLDPSNLFSGKKIDYLTVVAMKNRNYALLKALGGVGVDFTKQLSLDSNGCKTSAWKWALSSNDSNDLIDALSENTDLNKSGKGGVPLHISIELAMGGQAAVTEERINRYEQIMGRLVEKGADVNAVCSLGNNAAHKLANSFSNQENEWALNRLLVFLTERGVDFEKRNNEGLTANDLLNQRG